MATAKTKDFEQRTNTLARQAKALAHPARLAILETLAETPGCICGQIVEVLPLAQSTVSQHLKELKEAGLITGEIDGKKSCYCLNSQAVRELEKTFSAFIKILKKNRNTNPCC